MRRFAFLFGAQAVALAAASAPFGISIAGALGAWAAGVSLLMALAYHGGWHAMFGKRPDGGISIARAIVFAPYVCTVWVVWNVLKLRREERCHEVVGPGLWLARRLGVAELPAGVSIVVDLTAELPDPLARVAGVRYVAFPILDGGVPEDERFDALVYQLVDGRGMLVHCAAGHGRTGLFAACWLVAHGHAENAEEAYAVLRRARPLLRMNRAQMAFVERFTARHARAAVHCTQSQQT